MRLLAGKPLIAYSIEAALKSPYIEKVVVPTEDEEIAEIARKSGAEATKRPIELAKINLLWSMIKQIKAEVQYENQ